MRRRLAQIAALGAAGALAAGCGGGDEKRPVPSGPPKASEPLKTAVRAYEKAAADQDCYAFVRFEHSTVRPRGKKPDDPPDAQECENLGQSYVRLQDFKANRARQFGTAVALVEGNIEARVVELIFTLDFDGRWKQVVATPPGASPQLGNQPVQRNSFAKNAAAWVEAQRRGDCRTIFRLYNSASTFIAQDDNDRGRFCQRFERGRSAPQSLPAQLARSPGAKPVDLGGTPDFHFFGLATAGGGYWTVISSTLPPGLPAFGHAQDSILDYYPNRRPAGA